MYSCTLSLTPALEGAGSQHTPRPLYPRGKTPYPLYRRLDGPQGRSARVRKMSPPTGIRSPDCPARSELLYRLSYRGVHKLLTDYNSFASRESSVGTVIRYRPDGQYGSIPHSGWISYLLHAIQTGSGVRPVFCSKRNGRKALVLKNHASVTA